MSMFHIISTINGQTNEGMRNVATHIAKSMERQHHMVCRSGLKNIPQIIKYSRLCGTTLIFAKANKPVYWLARFTSAFSKNLWIVCVQKPEEYFLEHAKEHPLNANYLALRPQDIAGVELAPGFRKETFSVGINTKKFKPVTKEEQKKLKEKYGFSADKPLVIHVGHCSSGRRLEDFGFLENCEKLVVASGMFESEEVVKVLRDHNVRIMSGYIENVEEIYQMADVYFFPTLSTEHVISVPLSVMEALACGTPVIAYRDFEPVKGIKAEEDAVLLLDSWNQLQEAIPAAAARKADRCFLTEPKSWEEAANEVIETVERDKQ